MGKASAPKSVAFDFSNATTYTFDALISLLEVRKWPLFATGEDQYKSFCPVCEDDNSNSPSLAIGRGRSNQAVIFCFSGKGLCGLDKSGDAREPKSVRLVLRLFEAEQVPMAAGRRYQRRSRKRNGNVVSRGREVARYVYPNGRIKVRYEHPDGWNKDFRWVTGKSGATLYQPPTDEEKHEYIVCLVEGEKDVLTLRALDYIATTVSEGYLTRSLAGFYLKGATVAVFCDYDDHGRVARDAALDALDGIAEKVFWVPLPGLQWRRSGGEDVSDWLANDGTAGRLDALIDAAERGAR